MSKRAIEAYILEAKRDMVVELDLAYTLGVLKGAVPDEDRLNQVAYTLLNTCLRLHKMTKAVGIEHVRVKVGDNGPDKPRQVLGENFERVIGICAMVLRTSEDISIEDLEHQFGLSKAQIWQSVPELVNARDGHKFFPVHTPIRQLVKSISDCNAGLIGV